MAETGYLTAGPGLFPDEPLGEVSDATLSLEKPISGGGGRYASWNDTDNDGVIDNGETVYWKWNTGPGHSNSLIPLYARGVGAELFGTYAVDTDIVCGPYLDNTDVFTVMNSVVTGQPTNPSVFFDMATSSRSESFTTSRLAVSLNWASSQTITVNYAVTGGTATGGGVDYTLASGSLLFNPGETSNTMDIGIIDDSLVESNETIIVTLSNPTNAILGPNTIHTYTITDNDVSSSTFTAYNDLSWVAGQANSNITLYTTGQSGLLKDYATGFNTAVTLSIAGGAIYTATLTQGGNANPGTDAYTILSEYWLCHGHLFLSKSRLLAAMSVRAS